MRPEELEKGKALAEASFKWHRSTMPFPDDYVEEDIPKLIRWLEQVAFPELEKGLTSANEFSSTELANAKLTINKIAVDDHRNRSNATRKK